MTGKDDSRKSDGRAIATALLHVAALFVPVAFVMLILAGLSAHAPQDVDTVRTGSIDSR